MTKEKLMELISKTNSLTLLYVEDDPLIFENTITILDKFFNKIVFAKNGQEGLALFKENDIDIIVSDINMPLMDGLTMLEHIKKIDSSVPSIVLTAHNEREFSQKAALLKIDGYLLKPVKLHNLFELLMKVTK